MSTPWWKRKCIPLKPPIPTKFQGNIEKAKTEPVPAFISLVNFPANMPQNSINKPTNLPEGMRCCVMCGQACPCAVATRSRKSKPKQLPVADPTSAMIQQAQQQQQQLQQSSMTQQAAGSLVSLSSTAGQQQQQQQLGLAGDNVDNKNPVVPQQTVAIIPPQNKGLCSQCDVNVWVVIPSGLEIKWCKGCKNFRAWAAFGDKGHATKCLKCRDRQREKYELLKVVKGGGKEATGPGSGAPIAAKGSTAKGKAAALRIAAAAKAKK